MSAPPLNHEPYHRLGAGRKWHAPLGELFLVVVFWFVWSVGVFFVLHRFTHAKLKELDEMSHQAITLVGLAGLLPAAFYAVHVSGRDWRTLLSVHRRIRWRPLARYTAIALALNLVQLAVMVVAVLLDKGLSGFSAPDWRPFLGYCALIIGVVPFQAAGEEVMFRGVLQQVVGAYVRWMWLPITLSAIAFMFAHGSLQPSSVSICAMGIAYAWLAIRTGGLEPGIAHHIVNNLFAFITVAARRGIEHTGVQEVNGRVGWVSVAFDIALIAIYVGLVMRMQRRLAQSALATANQVEQHAPERSGGVEHADHGGDAQPLPPEQQ